jgi:hypothetical protein
VPHTLYRVGEYPKNTRFSPYFGRCSVGTMVVTTLHSFCPIGAYAHRTLKERETMMIKKRQGFLTFVMLVLVSVLALPTVAFAQGNGKHKGRGKPTDVFVNGHDARDGRWDKNNAQRRRSGNNDDWRYRDRNGDGVIDWRDNVNNDDGRYRNDDRRNRNRRSSDGYGNYGGSFDLRQTALNAGFAAGVREGRKDRSRGEGFEFRDEGDYRSATKDYSSRLGDRGLYQTYFRQAFENGYRDGYAGY